MKKHLKKLFGISAAVIKNPKLVFELVSGIYKEIVKTFWTLVELYAHERALGKKFKLNKLEKLSSSKKQYYKVEIDVNLLKFLIEWSGFNGKD